MSQNQGQDGNPVVGPVPDGNPVVGPVPDGNPVVGPVPAEFPAPFEYDASLTKLLPILDEDEHNEISAVVRGIARGTYPRSDALPTALNAYNLTRVSIEGNNSWAYFHGITLIEPADQPQHARRIVLAPAVIDDLKMPWQSMHPDDPKLTVPTASYRFLCFIHRHLITTTYSGRQSMFTISIWDREFEWLSWHDMYPHDREARRNDIKYFWENVEMPGCPFMEPREDFMKTKFRWRTSYHACERTETALRDIISPRHTLWAVMGISMYHLNGGIYFRHINLVPDRFELFGGTEDTLLPCLFVRLVWLLMSAPRRGEENIWDGNPAGFNGSEEMRKYVERFRITGRMTRMKLDVRNLFEVMMELPPTTWLKDVTWLFPALRIP